MVLDRQKFKREGYSVRFMLYTAVVTAGVALLCDAAFAQRAGFLTGREPARCGCL